MTADRQLLFAASAATAKRADFGAGAKFLPYALDILFTVGPLHVPIELNTMPIAGATCPVTIAGALLQANIEILAGICLSQVAFPGMPLMYAPRNLILDWWTGLSLQGRIEAAMMAACQAQLAAELYSKRVEIGLLIF